MEHELRMLLKRPGNDACADCGGRYPRFASISLAVFLCNRCYGIHRSVGTHVTRTKTVGLDRWSLEEVHRMSAIGNVVANSYWEENAPPTFQRPNADSPDFEVEKWIRDKYERKLFCSSSREPPSVPPQMAEPVHPDASTRSVIPKVKLLPRGTLRCGLDCTSTKSPCDYRQVKSRRPSQPCTSNSPFNSQIAFSSQNAADPARRSADQSELVFDDDEEFGEFVQA